MKMINELFNIETGTTPSTKVPGYWEDGDIDWLTPADLNGLDNNIHIGSSSRRITRRALEETGLSLLPAGSILMSTRAPVGYVGILREKAVFNQGCKGLVPRNPDEVCPEYYCHYLRLRRELLENASSGSTFKELSKDAMERFAVPHPSIKEQRKVAEIIGGIDEAIGITEQRTVKAKQLRSSLLLTLYTRGICHSKFSATAIGELPENWQVTRFNQIADFKNGLNFSKEQRGKHGIPVIDVLNMYGDSIEIKASGLYRVAVDSNSTDIVLEIGDILFVRSSLKREGAARAALFVGSGENTSFCGFIIRARITKSDIDPKFIAYYFRTEIARARLLAGAGQVTITNISQGLLGSSYVPLPLLDEQKKIVRIMSVIEEIIDCENCRLIKLLRIKRELMVKMLSE